MTKNKTQPTQLKVGAHVSMAGGFDQAVERASQLGANCLQIFSGSPRVWSRPKLDNIEVDKYYSKVKDLSVEPTFIHSLYLINLVSDHVSLRQKSYQALVYDLGLAKLLKSAGVVVHLGSHQGRGWLSVRQDLAELLKKLLAETPDSTRLLIENTAGQKGKIGGDLLEIAWLIDQVDSPRLGWCLDTCHAHAAGYNLGRTSDYNAKENVKEVSNLMTVIKNFNLESRLWCVHVNDSRDPFGSGRDRHANLGQGTIKEKDFLDFLGQDLIRRLPMILEVPGYQGKGPDQANIEKLKTWLSSHAR